MPVPRWSVGRLVRACGRSVGRLVSSLHAPPPQDPHGIPIGIFAPSRWVIVISCRAVAVVIAIAIVSHIVGVVLVRRHRNRHRHGAAVALTSPVVVVSGCRRRRRRVDRRFDASHLDEETSAGVAANKSTHAEQTHMRQGHISPRIIYSQHRYSTHLQRTVLSA